MQVDCLSAVRDRRETGGLYRDRGSEGRRWIGSGDWFC